MTHPVTVISLIPGLQRLPDSIVTAALVMVSLIVLASLARRQLRNVADPVIPDDLLTLRNVAEILVEGIVNLAENVVGAAGRRLVHFFGSLFSFILAANLTGLLPGFSPPTDNFNVTFGLGVVSFLAYNYYGLRAQGLSYLKEFVGPVWWLAGLMVVVELFSHAFRPFSLGIRLFGNMFADHLLIGIFTDLTKLVIPVPFYFLGALVSFIQATVFTMLTMVYVAMAIGHER